MAGAPLHSLHSSILAMAGTTKALRRVNGAGAHLLIRDTEAATVVEVVKVMTVDDGNSEKAWWSPTSWSLCIGKLDLLNVNLYTSPTTRINVS